jgi:hypothetical protein
MIWTHCAGDASIEYPVLAPPVAPINRSHIRGSAVGLIRTNSRIADEFRGYFSSGSSLRWVLILGKNPVPPSISRFNLPIKLLELTIKCPDEWWSYTRKQVRDIMILINLVDQLTSVKVLRIKAIVRGPYRGMKECLAICKILERHADVDEKLEEYSLEVRAYPWRSVEWEEGWYRD